MSTLVVEGGRPLSGKIRVQGNKNSALPLLAACLLTDRECVLTNMPCIRDVDVMIELLIGLGAEVSGAGTSTVRICCSTITTDEPDEDLVGRLRGSVLLLGPLLVRRGTARLATPGGDFPARRTTTTHYMALEALGARPLPGGQQYLQAPDGFSGTSIYLDEASVTGTETALLAAAAADGTTRLRHAACEPHVVELCQFLRKMGVDIEGEGTNAITVRGGNDLSGAEHRLNGDHIEAGSWAVVAAITGGNVEIVGARAEDLEPIVAVFKRMGVHFRLEEEMLSLEASTLFGAGRITVGLWPGFPSDLVSLVTVLATRAEGQTLIHDWMYELRLFALEQLSGMRADLFLCDPHRIIVRGPSQLVGRELDSRDLRSGMALIAAALAADGVSKISPLEIVERGYARVVDQLKSLGAQIERQE